MIYFDFEYRDPFVLDDLVLMALLDSKNPESGVFQFDLRAKQGRQAMLAYFNSKKSSNWCCFNGLADLTCLITLGCDIKDLLFIDAMTEARMITLSHEDYHSPKAALLSTLKTLGVKGEYSGYAHDKEHKDSTRSLILDNVEYSPEQWRTISEYADEDVIPLPDILQKVEIIHRTVGDKNKNLDMFARGEYTKAVTLLNYASRGFPVDEDRLNAIYSQKGEIVAALAVELNNHYCSDGPPLYKDKKATKTAEAGYTFNQKGFEWLITDKLGINDWKQTASGKLNLTKDYLEERAKRRPALDLLRRTRDTIAALKGTDFRAKVVNGYIRPQPKIFDQKTGRNTPLPASGLLLNLTPWLRSALIRPKPGMAFIGIDWSQQEIGIAARLSEDDKMLKVYQSSDPYLELAKMAGAAPANATKKTHGPVRQNFKAVQLGIGYGKGKKSLAVDVWLNNHDANGLPRLSVAEAEVKATEIYDWHKNFFHKYWTWVNKQIALAKAQGYIKAKDGWTMYCSRRTRETQLQNFPMQANGAYMAREAMMFILEAGLELVCPLHDAFYVQCELNDADRVAQILGECMDKASAAVLNGFVLRRDEAKINTWEDPYYDDRGFELYEVLSTVLGPVMNHPEHERVKLNR